MLRKSRDSSADSSSLDVEVQLEVTVPSRVQISPRNQTLTEVRNGLAWLAEPSQRKKLKAMEKKEGMGKIEIMKKEYPEFSINGWNRIRVVWLRIRLRKKTWIWFVPTGWILIRSISDRIRNPGLRCSYTSY